MAIAIVQDLFGMTQESHDAYEEHLRTQKDPPPGLILYAAGPADGRFRIIEIWESEETRTPSTRVASDRQRSATTTPVVPRSKTSGMPR